MANKPSGKKDMLSNKLSSNLRNSTQFDWYQGWDNLKDIVSQFITRESKLLNVGAGKYVQTLGNSTLSQ